MALLDKILALLGTNRTRMEWKLRAWRRGWDRRMASAKNRAQNLTYAHQTCPKCSHPAGADEATCSRCGEPLGGRLAHRARRAAGFLWADGTPVIATVLIASIVACYAATLLWDSKAGLADGIHTSPSPLALIRFGSLVTTSVTEGEWWRLVTSTFLHLDVLHLAMNVLSLWSVAVFLEDAIGKAKTLALYLVLGVGAGITSYLWHTHTGPGIGHSAGASGAICGLIGVAIGFATRRRNVARHLRGHYIGWAIWIAILALSPWNIDNAAHMGGLGLGFAAGLVVRRKGEGTPAVRRAWSLVAIGAVGGAIAAVAFALATPAPAGWGRGEAEAEVASDDPAAYDVAAPFLDPETPAVQERIAAARAAIEAEWERLPASAALDRRAGQAFYSWRSFHPVEHLYTSMPGEVYGRYLRLFGPPEAPGAPWVVRHRASGTTFTIASIEDGMGILETADPSPAGEAAARRLAELMDQVPPADFSIVRSHGGRPEVVGARGGRAYTEPVDIATALAFYTSRIERLPPGQDRVSLQLQAMLQISSSDQASPADVARVAVYWPEVLAALEADRANPLTRAWAQALPYLAEQLDLPADQRERARSLAR
jgi:membrane associated rhomboid family serine protease